MHISKTINNETKWTEYINNFNKAQIPTDHNEPFVEKHPWNDKYLKVLTIAVKQWHYTSLLGQKPVN